MKPEKGFGCNRRTENDIFRYDIYVEWFMGK